MSPRWDTMDTAKEIEEKWLPPFNSKRNTNNAYNKQVYAIAQLSANQTTYTVTLLRLSDYKLTTKTTMRVWPCGLPTCSQIVQSNPTHWNNWPKLRNSGPLSWQAGTSHKSHKRMQMMKHQAWVPWVALPVTSSTKLEMATASSWAWCTSPRWHLFLFRLWPSGGGPPPLPPEEVDVWDFPFPRSTVTLVTLKVTGAWKMSPPIWQLSRKPAAQRVCFLKPSCTSLTTSSIIDFLALCHARWAKETGAGAGPSLSLDPAMNHQQANRVKKVSIDVGQGTAHTDSNLEPRAGMKASNQNARRFCSHGPIAKWQQDKPWRDVLDQSIHWVETWLDTNKNKAQSQQPFPQS